MRVEGALPGQVERAAALIEELIPKRRSLSASGRFEGIPILPRDAWLEGLVNAVVHRSYSMSGDHIRVELFPNRLYTQSTDAVRLTLYATDAVPDAVRVALPRASLRVLDQLRASHRPLGTGPIADLLGIARPTAIRSLRALKDAGLVAWDGDSPNDPHATWRLL